MRKFLLLLATCASCTTTPLPNVDNLWTCEATIYCGPIVDEPDGSDETTVCSDNLNDALGVALESAKTTADQLCGPVHAMYVWCDTNIVDVCF